MSFLKIIKAQSDRLNNQVLPNDPDHDERRKTIPQKTNHRIYYIGWPLDQYTYILQSKFSTSINYLKCWYRKQRFCLEKQLFENNMDLKHLTTSICSTTSKTKSKNIFVNLHEIKIGQTTQQMCLDLEACHMNKPDSVFCSLLVYKPKVFLISTGKISSLCETKLSSSSWLKLYNYKSWNSESLKQLLMHV